MNVYDFSSDKIDIFIFLVDGSGSMEGQEENVERGMALYRKSFDDFPEVNSIAVSICHFNDGFYPNEFRHISDFRFNYRTGGSTALYYSIFKASRYLDDYMKEVTKRTGVIPRATFILLSDGVSCRDKMSKDDACDEIRRMNMAGINTVFVAFGDGVDSYFGKDLGFVSQIDVKDKNTLVNFLGVELSKSCKEQSQSMKSLGANFFSKAVDGSKSDAYSHTTAQALEDDSWINDI